MEKTVVGLMDTAAEAERVVRDLTNTCRCDRADIGLMARGAGDAGAATDEGSRSSEMAHGALKGAGTGAALGGVLGLVAGVAALSIPGFGPFIAAGPIAATMAGAGVGAAAGGVIGALANLGVPEDEAHYYAEGVRRGGTLITVHARSEVIAECAATIMRQHGAVDIEERSQQWRGDGWTGKLGSGREGVVPVVQEDLLVGKRAVDHGGVRVYSHVIETPAEQKVHLREEHVNVERKRVDRPVQAGEGAFRERTIEVRETIEEPVVSKRARVVEEVRVSKDVTEHDETVRDTVRRTDVKIDRATGARAAHRYCGHERRISAAPYTGLERRAMH